MITKSKFRPRWGLSNPHLQTIVASKLKKSPFITTKQERIELPDGDFLDVNWSLKPSGPVVCLFHGLAGGVNSLYIKDAFNVLESKGMRPALMHWRGCSGEPNRLARSYHSGATDDIEFFINLVRSRFTDNPVFALSYSLGANALLMYLGKQGSLSGLQGAIAICPPLVLSIGADKLNSGITRIYQRHLLTEMRRQHELKRAAYPKLDLPPARIELNTFWKFDDALTAPIHGFKGAHDYYQRCSSRQMLPSIKTPTHILYALDDPFFTPAVLPDESELSESVTLELADNGGHVGFIAAADEAPWLALRTAALFSDWSTSG